MVVYTYINKRGIETHRFEENDRNKEMDNDSEVGRILEGLSHIFMENVLSGLSPEGSVSHRIDTGLGAESCHCPLFQLLSAELIATKEYVTFVLEKKNKTKCFITELLKIL